MRNINSDCCDRRSVNQYELVPSPRGFTKAPSVRVSIRHHEGYTSETFSLLLLKGLHVKHAVQCGIRAKTQHLLRKQGKPKKSWKSLLVRGPFGFKPTSSQQSCIKYASRNISPYTAVFLWKKLWVVHTNIFLCNLGKHQTVYNTCWRHECISALICLVILVITGKIRSSL
jgi:hypothetical protein